MNNYNSNYNLFLNVYVLYFTAIISQAPSSVDREVDIEIDTERERRTSCCVYFALVLFGLSANLVSNAIWIQLPALSTKLPEKQYLSVFLLGLLELGNISGLCYLLARRCSRTGVSEIPLMYIGVILSITCSLVLGFFWDYTIDFLHSSHSLTIILCGLVAGQISGLAGITYIPFGSRLKAGYITAILLGDGFAALLPHIVGVAEGLSIPMECKPTQDHVFNINRTRFSFSMNRGGRHRPSTTPIPMTPPKLRFPEYYFFLSIAGLTVISGFALILLRYVPSIRFEYDDVRVECMDEVEVINPREMGIEDENEELWQTQPQCDGTYILDDGSVRQSLRTDGIAVRPSNGASPAKKPGVHFRGAQVERPRVSSRSSSQPSRHTSTGSEIRDLTDPLQSKDIENRIPSFTILMLITFWVTAVTQGPLSTVRAHACLPQGNNAFFIGTLVMNVVNIITCLAVLRLSSKMKVTLVVAFTSLGTIMLTYFVALIAFSHESEAKEHSPLFGSMGELLAVSSLNYLLGTLKGGREGGRDGGMDGRTEQRMEGGREGWTDGWTDGGSFSESHKLCIR